MACRRPRSSAGRSGGAGDVNGDGYADIVAGAPSVLGGAM